MIDLADLPPIASSPVSVILVVNDANAESEATLNDWITFLNGFERDYELLLVGARAGTSLESLAGHCTRAKAVPTTTDGFGVALGAGLRAAQHPLVCYTTCDRRYQPKDLKGLFKEIDKVHVVYGVRRLRPSWRAWAFGWFVRLMFAIRLRDVGCLYVLARRSIFARMPIQSTGTFAHVEIMAKANFLTCVMSEANVDYRSEPAETDTPWRADFRRVYKQPDFGLVKLVESPAAPAVS